MRLSRDPLVLLRLLVLVGACAMIGAYLFVALSRIGHPFALEPLEGAVVDHIARWRSAEPFWIAPTLDWTPFLYPPGYYIASSAVASIVGDGFVAPRAVSLASSIGVLALIALTVRHETGRWQGGLLAAGLFAATFEASGDWMDIGRVDSLFLFLALSATMLVRRATSAWTMALAGGVLSAAFLTKQGAVFFAAPLTLWALWQKRRHGLVLAGVFVGLSGAIYLAATLATDNWYHFYLFDVPSRHPLVPPVWTTYWTKDLLGSTPVLCVLAVICLPLSPGVRPKGNAFIAALLVCGICMSYVSRLKAGGVLNALMPAFAVLAIAAGMVADTPGPGWRRLARAGTVIAIGLQLYLLSYHERIASKIPTEADRVAGNRAVAALRQVEGRVFLPTRGHMLALAGKKPCAHMAAMKDIVELVRTSRPGERANTASMSLWKEFLDATVGRRFAAIVADEDLASNPLQAQFDKNYVLAKQLITEPDVLITVVKPGTRPQFLYLLRRP